MRSTPLRGPRSYTSRLRLPSPLVQLPDRYDALRCARTPLRSICRKGGLAMIPTRTTLLCLALVMSLACREKATHTFAGEVALSTAPPSRAELAMFAPLPRVMAAPGVATTSEQVALGRRLFHEPVLSRGHDVSCNSCHGLNGYGSDGRRVSFGDLGHAGDRNAPSVYNAAGQIAQFWDGRAANVEEQAKGPILNPGEMAMPDPKAVLAHL